MHAHFSPRPLQGPQPLFLTPLLPWSQATPNSTVMFENLNQIMFLPSLTLKIQMFYPDQQNPTYLFDLHFIHSVLLILVSETTISVPQGFCNICSLEFREILGSITRSLSC